MKPFFKYWGGKRRICKWVLSHFPTDYEKLKYVEPFVGSGVLFFAKKPSWWELLNDKDQHLMCLFRAVRQRPSKLFNLIKNTLYNVEELKYANKILSGNIKTKDYVLIAWAKFVTCELSLFSNGTNILNLHKGRNKASFFVNKLKNFELVRNRLRNSHFLSHDALRIIRLFDSKDTFFYLDPPYPDTDQRGYVNGYTVEDFNNLTNALKEIKGKYLLSFELKDGMECKDLQGRYLHKIKMARNSKVLAGEGNTFSYEYLLCNYKNKTQDQLSLF